MNNFDNIPAPMYGPPPVFYDEKMIVDAENIIFDFGGVLMKHDMEGCQHAFRQFMSDEDIANVLGLGNNKPDSLRSWLEEGNLGRKEFLNRVLKHSKSGTTERQVIDAWNKIHAGIPEGTWMNLKLLRKKGFRTYLLSNTDEIHWQHTLSLFRGQIEQFFDDVFLSFKMHCSKPDERIFKEVDSAIGAAPGRTIFVDDTTANREAAERYVGWETCWDMKSLLREIELKELAQEIVTQRIMP